MAGLPKMISSLEAVAGKYSVIFATYGGLCTMACALSPTRRLP